MQTLTSEYRYVMEGTPFKLTAFAGVAELSGGSSGGGGGERDDDGTYWAGGVGLRYPIDFQRFRVPFQIVHSKRGQIHFCTQMYPAPLLWPLYCRSVAVCRSNYFQRTGNQWIYTVLNVALLVE